MRTCMSHTPTKRPTAGEIVELLYNNPRLVSPCIDVPLASVQVERSDSLELLPKQRKPSGSVSQKSQTHIKVTTAKDNKPSDFSFNSGEYSPMHAPNTSALIPMAVHKDGLTTDTAGLVEEDEHSDMKESSSFLGHDRDAYIGSYSPPVYIELDHSNTVSEYYNLSSVGSL